MSRSAISRSISTAARSKCAAKRCRCRAANGAFWSAWCAIAAAASPRRRSSTPVYGIFDEDVDENVVESHISKLRKKLKHRLGYDPIDSKRFLGYCLKRPGGED